MEWLHPTNRLGSYANREEFQIDRVIVQVTQPSPGSLELANRIFDDLWRAVPTVISAAELRSREEIPGYWDSHDAAGTSGDRLTLFGIWFDPSYGGWAEYEVGAGLVQIGRVPSHLPELPDDYSIMLSRAPDGSLRILE